MRTQIGQPVYIQSGSRQIKLQHMAELLNLCEEWDLINLQAALQKTICTHLEWIKEYRIAQKEKGL